MGGESFCTGQTMPRIPDLQDLQEGFLVDDQRWKPVSTARLLELHRVDHGE